MIRSAAEIKHDIRLVLIGTDLEEESGALVRKGVEIARAAGARVHIAHGYVEPAAFMPAPVGAQPAGFHPMGYVGGLGLDESVLARERERVQEKLAAQVREAGIGPDELHGQTLRPGVAHRVLPDLAREIGADLLVVGATAGGRLHRRLGSTADRVLRRSICPVLVVRERMPVPPRKALAPVDLSPLAAEAMAAGLAVLSRLAGGALPEVEALFVLSPMQRQVAPQFSPEQVDRFAAEELDRFVDAHAGAAAGQVQRKVRAGNTRQEIFAEISRFHPDLVFLGTHGLGGFDRFVLGSVAADVVREAHCSVLVVPPAVMRGEEEPE